jgi:hypothetical protein
VNRDQRNVVDIAHQAAIKPASASDAMASRGRNLPDAGPLVPLATVDAAQWQALSERSIEPNGYYLPGWELGQCGGSRPHRRDGAARG